MTQTIFDGITASRVTTPRLTAQVLQREGGDGGPVVVFVHGNVSSALFWQRLMLALPPELRAIAIDLRGFGGSDTLPVDATRGLRDFSDDLASVIDELGLERVHLVGWSMGGGVVLQYLIDHADHVASVTLESPLSPYGFGGTTGLDGRRTTPDAAGTGGGGANPDFVARLAAGDATAESPLSPLSVYLGHYVKPPFTSPDDEVWVASMLTTATGEDNYPGDSMPSESWPGFGPGRRGVLNTMAPTHLDLTGIVEIDEKPPILWIRGLDDLIVSDASFYDLNNLGKLGVIPGWPGDEVAPPQPMVGQMRAVLDRYAAAGGSYEELALADCGHSPHLEHPAESLEALVRRIG